MCFSCEHDKVVSAVDDLLSLVADNNLGHYVAATQDSDLHNVLCVLVYYVWSISDQIKGYERFILYFMVISIVTLYCGMNVVGP
jgi:hypothetical protein